MRLTNFIGRYAQTDKHAGASQYNPPPPPPPRAGGGGGGAPPLGPLDYYLTTATTFAATGYGLGYIQLQETVYLILPYLYLSYRP